MAARINKLLELPKQEYYQKHLAIINQILPQKMTSKEIEVLAAFMVLEGDITVDRFGLTARRVVKEKLNLSNQGLSNHLGTLQSKGFIVEDNKKLEIIPLVLPEKNEQVYAFRLVNLDLKLRTNESNQ